MSLVQNPRADEASLEAGWVRWRHDFHRFPETGFNEHRTAGRVAELLGLLGMRAPAPGPM